MPAYDLQTPPSPFESPAFELWLEAWFEAELDKLVAALSTPAHPQRGRPPRIGAGVSDILFMRRVEDVMRRRSRGVSDACRVLATKHPFYKSLPWITLRRRYYRALKRSAKT